MADSQLVIADGSNDAGELKLKRDAAYQKLEAKKAASNQTKQVRKNRARAVQDGRIAALSVRKYCPFGYIDGRVALVPMTPKTAVKIGMKLTEQTLIKIAGKRLLGVKSVGKMKNKKIRVSYGMSLTDRKKSTKGRKTGRTGTSRALTKGLVRRWITINVPLDANTIDILSWIEANWKKIPQQCEIGEQIYTLRNTSRGTNTDSDGKALVVA
jgi:hypothetical protein